MYSEKIHFGWRCITDCWEFDFSGLPSSKRLTGLNEDKRFSNRSGENELVKFMNVSIAHDIHCTSVCVASVNVWIALAVLCCIGDILRSSALQK